MVISRRVLLNGFCSLIPLHFIPTPILAGIRNGLGDESDIETEFAKHCPQDIFKFKSAANWQGCSPHSADNTYQVRSVYRSQKPMNAAQFYRYLGSILDWQTVDREVEKYLRSGQLLKISYSYQNNMGIWDYAFIDQKTSQAFFTKIESLTKEYQINQTGFQTFFAFNT